MTDFNQLHAYLLDAADRLRNECSKRNVPHVCLEIEIEGRPDGDLYLRYKLGEYGEDCKGNNLDHVLDEFLRRYQWNKRHDPLALPPPGRTGS